MENTAPLQRRDLSPTHLLLLLIRRKREREGKEEACGGARGCEHGGGEWPVGSGRHVRETDPAARDPAPSIERPPARQRKRAQTTAGKPN